MIEKIQFGGITRRPSDLSAKEGSCEESLNVVLDVNEVAPVIEPEDKTASLVGNTTAVSTNTTDRYIYIHKVGTYENYIAINETTNEVYAYIGGNKSSALLDFDTLSEVYHSITSVGKTLIISTDKNLHYILFKDGEYKYLGTKIPEPVVEFRAVRPATAEGATRSFSKSYDVVPSMLTQNVVATAISSAPHLTDMTAAEFWNDAAANYASGSDAGYVLSDDNNYSAKIIIDGVSKYIWDHYYDMRQKNKLINVFSAAVFVRSALKLYDESYIYQSVPYLLHTGSNASLVAYQTSTSTGGGVTVGLGNVFKAKVILTYPGLGDWGDIVRSVDIFTSTDINNPKLDTRIEGTEVYSGVTYFKFAGQTGFQSPEDVDDEILSKVNFYLSESKDVTEIGTGLTFNLKPISQDDLLVKPTLPDDNLSHHYSWAKDGISAYNSRLVLRGLSVSLYSGYPFLQSNWFVTSKTGVFTNDVMEFKYYIRSESGVTYTVIGKNSTGGQAFTYPTETVDSTTYYGLPSGFLFYPDPRCYRCDIYYGSASTPAYKYSVQMKEHPGLNGAYALCDLLNPVSSLATQDTTVTAYPSTEEKVFSEDNVLQMSEAFNPFQLLLTNRQAFTDPIFAVATTTKALSTGQFGQFPLYVFTKGGIWAVPITDTGSMSSAVPLSRDVALSSDSVTPIDQAIVFVTNRGVMLLTGSDVTELSPEMDGRHYALEEGVDDLLDDTEWEKYVGILQDTTPFMTFMKDAKAVYDYASRRLVFFNGKSAIMQKYQYVYKMDTQTWHKMSLLQTGLGFANILNGYPDALICSRNASNVYRVCDLSVRYNASANPAQHTLSQVLISRPIDFNLAYVSKTIRRMFVRGIFDRENVKTLLLGSTDGLSYHVIHSLRGPSNNVFFRVMVFATLEPTERISFLELDYEARFTDKPR